MSDHFDRDLFERAFQCSSGGCRRTCECGRIFFDQSCNVWTWDDGELEQLEKDPNATPVPYMVSSLNFDGKSYAADCDCWVDRAKAIAKWLDQNSHGICKWYNLSKEQALFDARALPEIKP